MAHQEVEEIDKKGEGKGNFIAAYRKLSVRAGRKTHTDKQKKDVWLAPYILEFSW